MTFALHPTLARDGIVTGQFPLCRVLLINDANYPWFVLVPEREGIANLCDLDALDHATLWEESHAFGEGILRIFAGGRLNVAALGNMVPQLHVHHIVRYESDPAWPGPVWGRFPMRPYEKDALQDRLRILRQAGVPGLKIHFAT